MMDENPYEAPQVDMEAGTKADFDGNRTKHGFEGVRFLVSMVFTIGAALALFCLVVFVGYSLIGTEWGHEFPVLLSAICGTGFSIALVFARIIVPEALEEARRNVERLLLSASLACALCYWLFEAFE